MLHIVPFLLRRPGKIWWVSLTVRLKDDGQNDKKKFSTALWCNEKLLCACLFDPSEKVLNFIPQKVSVKNAGHRSHSKWTVETKIGSRPKCIKFPLKFFKNLFIWILFYFLVEREKVLRFLINTITFLYSNDILFIEYHSLLYLFNFIVARLAWSSRKMKSHESKNVLLSLFPDRFQLFSRISYSTQV